MGEIKNQPIKVWALCIGSVVISAIFPILFLFCNNADQASLEEVWLPLLLFAGGAIGAFAVLLLLLRNIYSASLAAVVMAIVFTNYVLIEKVICFAFPMLRYWHVTSILLLLWLHGIYFIHTKISKDTIATILMVLCFAFGGLSTFNLIVGAPKMIDSYLAEAKAQEEMAPAQISQQKTDMPNVYYFIFDEYASFKQIEKYYNYDNSILAEYFEDNDFFVNLDSRNESIMTTTITTNLVNLDYVVDDNTPELERKSMRTNGKLFSLFEENGYSVQVLGDSAFFGQVSPLQMNIESTTKTAAGETLFDIIINQTAYYPFHKLSTSANIENILSVVDYLSHQDAIPQSPTFTMTYFVFPHMPFFVDEYGAMISTSQYNNWKDNQYYLGQFKYATKLMIQMLDNILENDPSSIIIVQSDHGARANTDQELFLKKFPVEDMLLHLNAVYDKGDDAQHLSGDSGVNTLRLIMNQLFDLNYDTLPIPVNLY